MKSSIDDEIWKLNRFTTLPVLLDLLMRKRLVLLDPNIWQDKNDSEIILEYKKRKPVRRLLALCFSHEDETVHHWKAYADGISGCCIEFDGVELQKVFEKYGLIHGKVIYRKIPELRKGSIAVDEIPFTKRWPYRCEKEYRVIRADHDTMPSFEIAIDLRIIRKITISQQMPAQVFQTIKELLRNASANPKGKVRHSTLYKNEIWIGKFRDPN